MASVLLMALTWFLDVVVSECGQGSTITPHRPKPLNNARVSRKNEQKPKLKRQRRKGTIDLTNVMQASACCLIPSPVSSSTGGESKEPAGNLMVISPFLGTYGDEGSG